MEQTIEVNTEFEEHITKQGFRIALNVVTVLIFLMFILELCVFKRVDYGKPAILTLMAAITYINDGIKNSNKLDMIIGIGEALLTLELILFYLGDGFL